MFASCCTNVSKDERYVTLFVTVLDDILPPSFFSSSSHRSHERVKSLLELARFLIPSTVQAWNRALGR